MKLTVTVTVVLIFICQFAWAEPHTWTFKSGATSAGEYVSSRTNMVIVRRDGRDFPIAISNLVDADVFYIKQTENTVRQAALELALQQDNFYRKHLGDDEFWGVKMLSTNRPITIVVVWDTTSQHGIPLCDAVQADQGDSVTSLPGILVRNLPASVMDFVNRENNLAVKIEQDARAAERADAVAPHSDATVAGTVAIQNRNVIIAATVETPQVTPQRAQANLMTVNVNDEQRELEKMKANYYRNATIIAFPSSEFYGNRQVWYCEGLKN
jgi:hypothetical protein